MRRYGLLGPVVRTIVLVLKGCRTTKDRVEFEFEGFEYMVRIGGGGHVEEVHEVRKLALGGEWM